MDTTSAGEKVDDRGFYFIIPKKGTYPLKVKLQSHPITREGKVTGYTYSVWIEYRDTQALEFWK